MTAASRLAIRFFAGSVPFSYAYEPLWLAARARDPADALVTLHESDVLGYTVDRTPAQRVVLRLTDEAAAELQRVRARLGEVPILVSLDDVPLYAASEYPLFGAAALKHPVVHLGALAQGQITIAAVQGAADGDRASDEEARRIDDPELRALFAARGALTVR